MTKTPLLDWQPPANQKHYGGDTFVAERDGARLNAQSKRVHDLMIDGCWRSLSDISAATGDPEASVSARLRDFRKWGFTVDRRYVNRGLFQYRVSRRSVAGGAP